MRVTAAPAITTQQLAVFTQLQRKLAGENTERGEPVTGPHYVASVGPSGLTLTLPERELAGRPAVQISGEEGSGKSALHLAMRLNSLGRGAAQETLAEGTVTDAGERVEVRREPVTEWFHNKTEGMEQGCTINTKPDGNEHEPVRLEIAPSEGWRAVPAFEKYAIALETDDGTSRIVWRGLRAWDAAGNAVRAWFERSAERQEFAIVLADAGAVYPVTVDPVYVAERLSGLPVQGGAGSVPGALVAFNGLLYFAANDGVNGGELWKSDGTAAGTVLVKDVEPGSGGSFIEGMTAVGAALYFQAYRADTGPELWKSDGTESGTVMVKDITPGAVGSYPAEFTPLGGFVYFRANGPDGYELWRTDGSAAGTTLVKDIYPGAFNSSYPEALTVMGGVLYFFAETSGAGVELWASDGSALGTVLVKDILPGSQGQFDVAMKVFNAKLYFAATDGVNGRELWQSNGTTAGTVMLKNISDAGGSSWPEEFTAVGSTLYFAAGDSVAGTELRRRTERRAARRS